VLLLTNILDNSCSRIIHFVGAADQVNVVVVVAAARSERDEGEGFVFFAGLLYCLSHSEETTKAINNMPYNLNSDEHYFYPDQGTDAATAVPWNNMTTIVLEKDDASSNHPNMVLTGVLMGLVTVFTIALCYLTIPSLLQWIRQKIPVSKARVQRRYETVEGWLISKVRTYKIGASCCLALLICVVA
jgi:hypothetical protein